MAPKSEPTCSDGSKRLSISSASANLTKNMMGSGIVSLPMALLQGSLMVGVSTMLVACVAQGCTCAMIGYLCKQLNCHTYKDMLEAAIGKRAGQFGDALVVVKCFFIGVVYNILVADFSEKALEGLFNITGVPRYALIWSSTIFVTLPLSHVRDSSPLAFTSVLGLVVIAYMVLFVIGSFVVELPESSDTLRAHSSQPHGSLFTTLSINTVAFQAHVGAPKYFGELGDDFDAWVVVVRNSYCMAFFIYTSFAISGLGLFGSGLLGNVLKNFPADGNVFVLLCWLGMAVSVLCTYPLLFIVGRDSFVSLIPSVQRASQEYPTTTHVCCTTLGVTLSATVACTVSDVSVVIETIGATTSAGFCWIFPALMYLKITSVPEFVPLASHDSEEALKLETPELAPSPDKVGKYQNIVRPFCYFLLILGFASVATGVLTTLKKLSSSEL